MSMDRRSFLKTVAALGATTVIPFKDIFAAPPMRGPKVGLKLYWRAIPDSGAVQEWSSKSLGLIEVDEDKGIVVTAIGAKRKDLNLPRGEEYVQFMISRDTEAEEKSRAALVGDWALYSIWVGETVRMMANQMECPKPEDGPALAPCVMNDGGGLFKSFDDVTEEGITFTTRLKGDLRLRLTSSAI